MFFLPPQIYNKVYETHGLEFRTPYLYIELYIL